MTKILSNRINIQDFVFCKEVRLGTYSVRAAVMPPAAIVAAKAMSIDQRAEPKYGERVPYVVIHGGHEEEQEVLRADGAFGHAVLGARREKRLPRAERSQGGRGGG